MTNIKYALIGCGRISPNHIVAAKEAGVEIVALCDLDISKVEGLIDKYGLNEHTKLYSNYQEMINNESLDLIAIATESGKHGRIALDCLKKGINLIIEKPIALSLDEADEIIRIATEKNIKVCTCHQNRFNKSIVKIREAIEKQQFGRLFYGVATVRWNRSQDYYSQAPWRGTWEQDGGTLMNQCIHNIDLLRWMMGDDIEEVVAITDNLNHPYIEAEDFGIALIKFKNSSYGVIEGTANIFPKNLEETLYIFGSEGTVKAGGKSVNLIEEWAFKTDMNSSEKIKKEFSEMPPTVYGFGHLPLYRDMKEAIIDNRQPSITALDGRKALELVLAIYTASKEKRNVKLPLYGVKTIDFQ